MRTTIVENKLLQQLADVRDDGQPEPVIAMLQSDIQPAEEIHVERDGILVPREKLTSKIRGTIITLSVAEAKDLLRKHAAFAGWAVSLLLERTDPRPDGWLLWIKNYVAVAGVIGGQIRFRAAAEYQPSPADLTFCENCQRGTHPPMQKVLLDDGRFAHIDTSRTKQVCPAASLVHMVFHRTLLPIERTPDTIRLPLDEPLLAGILHSSYATHPSAVAEAVRALERLGGGHEDWLLDVLGYWDQNRELDDAVWRELEADEQAAEVAAAGA